MAHLRSRFSMDNNTTFNGGAGKMPTGDTQALSRLRFHKINENTTRSQFLAYFSFSSKASTSVGWPVRGGHPVNNTECDSVYEDTDCHDGCVLASPGYPGLYPPNIRCRYLITSGPRISIAINFTAVLLPYNLVECLFFHLPSSPVRISAFPGRNERATGERKGKKEKFISYSSAAIAEEIYRLMKRVARHAAYTIPLWPSYILCGVRFVQTRYSSLITGSLSFLSHPLSFSWNTYVPRCSFESPFCDRREFTSIQVTTKQLARTSRRRIRCDAKSTRRVALTHRTDSLFRLNLRTSALRDDSRSRYVVCRIHTAEKGI
ncbi:hypothetical protein ALC53_06286 [Atta colombica]|uniref:CUB domain-containing protein n=1 Tax=Atta colombica TaxID=520822 RepID=A0A195BEK4_9HYME|nr:hypothetical protein ALC53_06286 [Atta colombica]